MTYRHHCSHVRRRAAAVLQVTIQCIISLCMGRQRKIKWPDGLRIKLYQEIGGDKIRRRIIADDVLFSFSATKIIVNDISTTIFVKRTRLEK